MRVKVWGGGESSRAGKSLLYVELFNKPKVD